MTFEPFADLRISTMTVIVELSFFIQPAELANKLCSNEPLLQTQVEMCKSWYKRLAYPAGTILHLQCNAFWRGVRRARARGRKKNDFINVVTVDVFTARRRVNVMIFKNGKIKIAGCESTNDAVAVVTRLVTAVAPPHYSMLFSNEMINISFSFPYCINKMGINEVFNDCTRCGLADIYFSFYEQTGPQYVNLKVYSGNTQRLCVVVHVAPEGRSLGVEWRDFKRPPVTSFTIFDRRVIMSGVDKVVMCDVYKDFLRIIDENREFVQVRAPRDSPAARPSPASASGASAPACA